MVYDDFLAEIFRITRSSDGYIYNRQVMMELYETAYGIHDHRHATHPLASVRQNNAESFIDHNLYDCYLDAFMLKNIHKLTGLDFDKFLNKPRYEIEKILVAAERFLKKESSVADEAMDAIKKTMT